LIVGNGGTDPFDVKQADDTGKQEVLVESDERRAAVMAFLCTSSALCMISRSTPSENTSLSGVISQFIT